MSTNQSFNKFNPPPPGLFLPYNTIQANAAEINRLVAPTPTNAYFQGLPPGIIDFFFQTPNEEIFTFNIDFSITPFTYLNASNVTTNPSPNLQFNLYNIPKGTIFIINGPSEYEPGASGKLILRDNPIGPKSSLDILPRTVGPLVVKNQFVVRNSEGLVAKAMN